MEGNQCLKEPAFATLDEFIAFIGDYARFTLEQDGQLAAGFVILCPDARVLALPADMDDDDAKTKSKTVAKLLCMANGATAVAFVAEAWASLCANGALPPSKVPDRKEIVIVSAEGYGDSKQNMLPIMRNSSHKFIGFGPATVPEKAKGRLTNILSNLPVTPQLQEDAKRLLSAIGIEQQVACVYPHQYRSIPRNE